MGRIKELEHLRWRQHGPLLLLRPRVTPFHWETQGEFLGIYFDGGTGKPYAQKFAVRSDGGAVMLDDARTRPLEFLRAGQADR